MIVDKQERATPDVLIHKYALPRSIIITDGGKGIRIQRKLIFNHILVNHNIFLCCGKTHLPHRGDLEVMKMRLSPVHE